MSLTSVPNVPTSLTPPTCLCNRACDAQPFEQRVRKHHCRCCGRVFCRACSRERAAIPSLNFSSPVRVCDSCSLLLQAGNPSNPFPGSTKAAAVDGGGSDDD